MRFITSLTCAIAFAGSAFAQTPAPVKVEGAWARPTVQGQKGGGAFMTLTAKENLKLVRVSTPAAGVAEIHEMKMEGDVMRMRAIDGLALPAGKPVALTPGGYHLMLLDLKAPLAKGAAVPLTLTFKDAKGVESQMQIQLPVAISAPSGATTQGGAP